MSSDKYKVRSKHPGEGIPDGENGSTKILRHGDFCVLRDSEEGGGAGDVARGQNARAL